MIIRETLLKEHLLLILVDEYDYSKDEANKWINEHIENIIEKMYDAESNYISMHVMQKG